MAGGTPEEQAEVRARLEVMEAEMEALMAEIRPMTRSSCIFLRKIGCGFSIPRNA
jgi:hypothetical protein